MAKGDLPKKLIGSIYSWAADTVYEPLVVNGAFRIFGGRLNDLVRAQGSAAAGSAAGRPILDLPVGTAAFTLPVAAASAGIVVGADIAEGMVRHAKVAAAEHGATNLVVVQADAHRLPFRTGAFGSVLCTNGLQVMPGRAATLAELRRVLSDDGTLYVSLLNMPLLSAPTAPTLFMSRPELKRSLEAAGFRVTRLERERLATLLEAEPASRQ
ncbi:MAG: class I SAM-dependent methyltransferase [Actinomycetota bacterium]|nr:class I SAM-dependent methyltransferase [Actinomycetota bacterium]